MESDFFAGPVAVFSFGVICKSVTVLVLRRCSRELPWRGGCWRLLALPRKCAQAPQRNTKERDRRQENENIGEQDSGYSVTIVNQVCNVFVF